MAEGSPREEFVRHVRQVSLGRFVEGEFALVATNGEKLKMGVVMLAAMPAGGGCLRKLRSRGMPLSRACTLARLGGIVYNTLSNDQQ